jgi:predicted HicB family RNase H-like nuclease
MKYKGYEAVIEFDEEDRLFVGKVINTRDIIVFDGLSVTELEQSFQAVINEYLADCGEIGKEPNKPFSGKFNLRISPDLHMKAATQAALKGISLNSFVESAIEKVIS